MLAGRLYARNDPRRGRVGRPPSHFPATAVALLLQVRICSLTALSGTEAARAAEEPQPARRGPRETDAVRFPLVAQCRNVRTVVPQSGDNCTGRRGAALAANRSDRLSGPATRASSRG